MRCQNPNCPTPEESAEGQCAMAGYGWREEYHEKCCPIVSGGEPCLGKHYEEAEARG